MRALAVDRAAAVEDAVLDVGAPGVVRPVLGDARGRCRSGRRRGRRARRRRPRARRARAASCAPRPGSARRVIPISSQLPRQPEVGGGRPRRRRCGCRRSPSAAARALDADAGRLGICCSVPCGGWFLSLWCCAVGIRSRGARSGTCRRRPGCEAPVIQRAGGRGEEGDDVGDLGRARRCRAAGSARRRPRRRPGARAPAPSAASARARAGPRCSGCRAGRARARRSATSASTPAFEAQ